MDDPPRDTKSVNDMVFDKINHIRSFNLYSGIASAHFEK